MMRSMTQKSVQQLGSGSKLNIFDIYLFFFTIVWLWLYRRNHMILIDIMNWAITILVIESE